MGRAAAEEFCARGWRVYGTSRRAQWPREDPPKEGSFIRLIPMDVLEEESVRAAVEAVWRWEGRLDVVLCNAGMGVAGPLELLTQEEAALQLQTNLDGALRTARIALPYLRGQGGGRIIGTSSLAAHIPLPYQALYSAGKAALEISFQALGMEGRPFHIQTCCVELGDTCTDFTGNRRYGAATAGDTDYRASFERSIHRMEEDERNGMSPKKAARCVVRQAERRHMKPLVLCGASAKAVYALRKFLPVRWSNAIVAKLYT